MAIWQGESKRKPSGGRRMIAHKKRKFEIGREPVLPTVSAQNKRKHVRVRAARNRVRMLTAATANVTDRKSVV